MKYLKIVGILGVILMVSGMLGVQYQKVNGRIVTSTFPLNGNTASTSPTYLATTAATTTFPYMGVQGSDRVDILLLAQASTTATEYRWVYEYSDNAKDWYGEDATVALDKNGNVSTVNGTVSVGHSTSTLVHSWVPGEVSSTTNKKVTVETKGAMFMRVQMKAYSAAGSIWGMVLRRTDTD